MVAINPYLNFKGRTEEAFTFYKTVFGGEFAALQRFKDVPAESKSVDVDGEKIMHMSLPIGKNVLMGTDVVGKDANDFVEGNNFSLTIDAESKEEADRLFKGLSNGGKVQLPMGDAFWGAYFGMLLDPFGIKWMINYPYPKKG